MSNKTSDEKVANDIKILKKFCEYEEVVVLTDNALEEVQDALQNILAEREQLLKERDVANDSVIAHKFAVMQQQINEKDKRIQELEAKLEFKKFGDLDNVEFEEYMSQFIPKQVVIDKVNEINKKYEDSKDENGESPYYYPDFTIRVLQKLLGTK